MGAGQSSMAPSLLSDLNDKLADRLASSQRFVGFPETVDGEGVRLRDEQLRREKELSATMKGGLVACHAPERRRRRPDQTFPSCSSSTLRS